MQTKNVLITGANKGIGFEIARQLAKKGFGLWLAGRNANALQQAQAILQNEHLSVQSLVMDISHLESVQAAFENLKAQNVLLDVLINNAAILLKGDTSLAKNSEEILEKTLQTNFYGALHVIKTFLPILNTPCQIINISSGGGSMADPVGGWAPAYCLSKTMLNGLTRQLAYELTSKQIRINAVCPGWVKTDMGGVSAPRSIEKGAETPVWLASEDINFTGKFLRDKKEIPW